MAILLNKLCTFVKNIRKRKYVFSRKSRIHIYTRAYVRNYVTKFHGFTNSSGKNAKLNADSKFTVNINLIYYLDINTKCRVFFSTVKGKTKN